MLRALSGCVLLWAIVACAPVHQTHAIKSASIAHVVLLWMKSAWQGDYITELKTATASLSTIPVG